MNILQVISSSRASGAEKHTVLLSDALRRRGHSVLAVCPPGGWLAAQLHAAAVPAVEVSMHGLGSTHAIWRLRDLVRRNQIDLIHTHLTRATYMGYLAGMLVHVPVVSTVHILSRDFAYRHLPSRNHWFVAVSDYLRQALIARGVPPSRVQTVYNGTDLSLDDAVVRAADLSVRAELGVPAHAEMVAMFGRVDSFKGAPILVRAAREIVQSRPNAYFAFVGHAEPGIQQALWEMAQADGIGDRLRFTGIRDDVGRLMEAMDVVAVPSLIETFGMVIVEAMAMGKPVVATRAGGIPELVADGDTGLLVERDPGAIADAVVSLLADPEARVRMGCAAQLRARTHFSAGRMAQDMECVYHRVLQGSHRGAVA